jgi:hypothetical protein
MHSRPLTVFWNHVSPDMAKKLTTPFELATLTSMGRIYLLDRNG